MRCKRRAEYRLIKETDMWDQDDLDRGIRRPGGRGGNGTARNCCPAAGGQASVCFAGKYSNLPLVNSPELCGVGPRLEKPLPPPCLAPEFPA